MITTRDELKEYILMVLGTPIINIEISDDQLNIVVDTASQKFINSHYNGTDVGWIMFDILSGQNQYFLDETIISVSEILTGDAFFSDETDEKWLMPDGIFGYRDDSELRLIDIEVWRQNIREFELYFKKDVLFDFNETTKKLTFQITPKTNLTVAMCVYASEDNDNKYRFYNDEWLKEYCVALAGIQWATNISKFDNVVLPGGAQFNHAAIESRYTDLKLKLEEELEDKYSEPIDPFVG